MDIHIINDAINTLENDDTTFDNVHELAMLYIVQERLNSRLTSMVSPINKEAKDILPAYEKYCSIKTRYQLGQTNEGEVIRSIKLVCKELEEFISLLYTGTDMNKERIYIKETICKLNERYSK